MVALFFSYIPFSPKIVQTPSKIMYCTFFVPNITKTAFVHDLGDVKGVERVGDKNRMVHPVPK